MVASPFLPASTNKHRAAGLATKPARRGWLPSRPDIAAGRAGALGRIQAVAGAGDVLDRQRAGGGRVGQEGRQRASVGSGRTVGGPVLGRQGLVGGGGPGGGYGNFGMLRAMEVAAILGRDLVQSRVPIPRPLLDGGSASVRATGWRCCGSGSFPGGTRAVTAGRERCRLARGSW